MPTKFHKETKDDLFHINVLISDSLELSKIDPASLIFFETVSSTVAEKIRVQIPKEYDEPDANRGIGKMGNVRIFFESDEMIGMTICVDLNCESATKVAQYLVELLTVIY